MSYPCKYCGVNDLRWEQWPEGWRLVSGDRSAVHRCQERYEAIKSAVDANQPPSARPQKKKRKHGAFLRVHSAQGCAVLTQTREPEPDTPESMFATFSAEPRSPWFPHHLKARKCL